MNGKEKAMEMWKKTFAIFASDKKIKWVVLIGFIGILLILFSEFFPQKTKIPKDAVSRQTTKPFVNKQKKNFIS